LGIRERKKRDYEKRRILILETARRLFHRKGFGGVTLDEIALEIEFSKGTIYSHFASKEEIFAQILLGHLNLLAGYLKEAASTSADREDGVKRALETYLHFYDQHREYGQLLFFADAISNRERIPAPLRREIDRKRIACLYELQRILRKKGRAGDPLTPNAATRLGLLLWGMINGILQLVESRQIERGELDKLVSLGFDIVSNGWNGLPTTP
jgi:AcrR family transcriptional regulator